MIELGERAIAVARRSQELENRIAEQEQAKNPDKGKVNPNQLVDVDVAPFGTHFNRRPFRSRLEVHRAHGRLIRLSQEEGTLYGEYLSADSTSARALIRAMGTEPGMPGPRIGFREYVHQTLGAYPRLIDPKLVEEQFQKVCKMFLEFEPKGLNPEGWLSFHEGNKIVTKEEKQQAFESAINTFVPDIQNAVGAKAKVDYKIVFDDLQIPAIVSVYTEKGQLIIRINTSSLNDQGWFWGVNERLAYHEVGGHGIQDNEWKANILAGKINIGYGITRQPNPAQWMEGLMDHLVYFVHGLYEKLSPKGKFAVEFNRLKNMLYNNVQILLNKPNPDTEMLVKYVQYYLPNEPRERILNTFRLVSTHPKFRGNSYAYAGGGIFFYDLSQRMSDSQKVKFLQVMFERPWTPDQTEAIAEQILAA